LNVQCNQLYNNENFHNCSGTPENTQREQSVFQGHPVLIANSRKVIGAQGRLATLITGPDITVNPGVHPEGGDLRS